jgi:succinylglutamate desuccinylase
MSISPFSDRFLTLSRTNHASIQTQHSFSLNGHTQVTVHGPGVIEFEPTESVTKSLIYSCGIHGNETAPIEICDDLVEDVLNETLRLEHRLLVIFGNLPAMDTATRFIKENLNRLFCGAHSEQGVESNDERERAAFLEQCVADFYRRGPDNTVRYHYDLHTAIRASKNEKFAVYPFLHGKAHNQEQLRFMADCGVKTILLSQSPTTTFSYHSSYYHDAHAFTVELGKVRPFGENDREKFSDAEKSLRALVSNRDYTPRSNLSDLLIYTVNQVILKTKDDFQLHFDDSTPNFMDYAKGTLLASEEGVDYTAEYDGEAIVFPNANVALGQRALLTVIPTTLDDA